MNNHISKLATNNAVIGETGGGPMILCHLFVIMVREAPRPVLVHHRFAARGLIAEPFDLQHCREPVPTIVSAVSLGGRIIIDLT